MLTDEEIAALLHKKLDSPSWLWEEIVREAVRMTAERCAEICEEIYLGRDNDHGGVCAAAIRERIKEQADASGWFDPNHYGRGGL